ncbi:MAG: L-threonate dehydrogenase [Rickettsiales bacterium]
MNDAVNTRPIGVIGLGSMGGGMALSLLRAGLTVHGCDLNPDNLKAFTDAGGIAAASPAALAAACDVVFIVVVNAAQTEAVLFGESGAVETMTSDSVVVSCATLGAEFAEKLGARLAEHQVLMLDAPISGGKAKAHSGELTVMSSGPERAYEKAEAALDAISETVFRLGDRAGKGSAMKTVNQLLAGVHITAAMEAMALGIKSGLDPEVVYEVVCNSAGRSWMFENRVPRVLSGDYTPTSMVNIFVKDLGIVLDAGKGLPMPLPVAAAAHQQFIAASGMGEGANDDSSVIKVYQATSGIDLPQKKD